MTNDKPDAGEAARRRRRIIEDCAEKMETTITELQDALLSSSKRIEELEKALETTWRDALEKAAKVADEAIKFSDAHRGDTLLKNRVHRLTAVDIADAIRALSPSGGGEMAQPQTASRSPASERSAK